MCVKFEFQVNSMKTMGVYKHQAVLALSSVTNSSFASRFARQTTHIQMSSPIMRKLQLNCQIQQLLLLCSPARQFSVWNHEFPISNEDTNHLFLIINNMTILMNSRHSYKCDGLSRYFAVKFVLALDSLKSSHPPQNKQLRNVFCLCTHKCSLLHRLHCARSSRQTRRNERNKVGKRECCLCCQRQISRMY